MAIQFPPRVAAVLRLMNLPELKVTDAVFWGQLAPCPQMIRGRATRAISPLFGVP